MSATHSARSQPEHCLHSHFPSESCHFTAEAHEGMESYTMFFQASPSFPGPFLTSHTNTNFGFIQKTEALEVSKVSIDSKIVLLSLNSIQASTGAS